MYLVSTIIALLTLTLPAASVDERPKCSKDGELRCTPGRNSVEVCRKGIWEQANYTCGDGVNGRCEKGKCVDQIVSSQD